jgi:5'-3' exonuclease
MSQMSLFQSPKKPGVATRGGAGHLLLVDGNNLVHRMFHAPTDHPASDRFASFLKRTSSSTEYSHAVVVWDPDDDATCWRRELWPAYKAQRAERPAGLDDLFIDVREQCDRFPIAHVQASAEADDMIASYAEAGVENQMFVTIMSSDKDMLQLLRDTPFAVRMRDDVRKVVWDPQKFTEKFGLARPAQFVDYLALIGDSGDGFPGVPKIGPKTAQALLSEHGSLESILGAARSIQAKGLRQRLLDNADLARTCYRLAKLRTNVALPLPVDETALRR